MTGDDGDDGGDAESNRDADAGTTPDADTVSDTDVSIRTARDGETDAIRHLLDAAMLTVPANLPERVAGGDALVAVAGDIGTESADVVGTLVLDGTRVEAVAVRKRRRADGVGTALVAAAARRTDAPLTATFRTQVRPFYEALGFEVEERDDRLFGTLPPDADATR
ncbi:GNAT family N-acetyltransferase [Halobaculum gomorrense]|uniref:Acetyltransferase (GNAT) domain-containing protein n=1 Tax=Halobaculum gomorrense TaxID=43928 RepID=A0A1M5QG95_9EURY|nr:GNAT family N-acetyltransferase [Halobaculum gomorrense]SHH13092.1 Acetyltransferase (GNAT) domain-containing protein [Halobaculum gomorrense]